MNNCRSFATYLKNEGSLDAILALETAPARYRDMGVPYPVLMRCFYNGFIKPVERSAKTITWGAGVRFKGLKEVVS